MDLVSYNEFKKRGDAAQEMFINFMEKYGNRKFVAGDRNGKVVNSDVIEEIIRCEYIPPATEPKRGGPRIMFFKKGKPNGYILPDELFLFMPNNKFELFDVKNRSISNLKEYKYKIQDYADIDNLSGIPVYVALIVWNNLEKGYDIYVRRAKGILEDTHDNSNMCIFDLTKFKKLTNIAIEP